MSQSSPLPTRIISFSASGRLAPICRPDRMRKAWPPASTLSTAGAAVSTTASLEASDASSRWVRAFFADAGFTEAGVLVMAITSGVDLAGLHDAQVRGQFLVGQHRQIEEVDFHQLAQVPAHV